MTDREMIEERLKSLGLKVVEWRDGDDGIEAVIDETWVVVEDAGILAEGEEGKLYAAVVGSEKYSNRRVSFSLMPEGTDYGEEVFPFTNVEPA